MPENGTLPQQWKQLLQEKGPFLEKKIEDLLFDQKIQLLIFLF